MAQVHELGKVTQTGDDENLFGLTPNAVQLLQALMAAQPLIQRAIVYGSRATGNYRTGSDIDLALDAPNMDFPTFLGLCTTADDLNLPWNLDICLLAHIDNPALREHIARVGIVLWQNPAPTPENHAH